jgi:hypothetical protein
LIQFYKQNNKEYPNSTPQTFDDFLTGSFDGVFHIHEGLRIGNGIFNSYGKAMMYQPIINYAYTTTNQLIKYKDETKTPWILFKNILAYSEPKSFHKTWINEFSFLPKVFASVRPDNKTPFSIRTRVSAKQIGVLFSFFLPSCEEHVLKYKYRKFKTWILKTSQDLDLLEAIWRISVFPSTASLASILLALEYFHQTV